jgi:hypothetical protein
MDASHMKTLKCVCVVGLKVKGPDMCSCRYKSLAVATNIYSAQTKHPP